MIPMSVDLFQRFDSLGEIEYMRHSETYLHKLTNHLIFLPRELTEEHPIDYHPSKALLG